MENKTDLNKLLEERGERERAEAFIDAFKTLFEDFGKGDLVPKFNKFIERELINEIFIRNHQRHFTQHLHRYLQLM